MAGNRVELEGSAPRHADGNDVAARAVSPRRTMTATINVRRRAAAEAIEGAAPSREEVLRAMSADAGDMEAVRRFAEENGLRVTEADSEKRSVKVSGTAAEFEHAFGVQLGEYGEYVSYRGPLTIPQNLSGIVVAVLGLDERPAARHR